MSAIQDAINAAKANAAAIVPAATPPAIVAKGAPLTLDDMMSGSINVDAWLKVNQYGLFVGTDRTPFQTLKVSLPLPDVRYNYSVKFGNPVQYKKSYDRVTCETGGSWALALAQAQQVDPNAKEYRSADIPFIVREDIKNAKGDVILEKGKTLGIGLSTTGWKPYIEFINKVTKTDGVPKDATFNITLGFSSKKTPKGEWGVMEYLDYQIATDD